MTNGFFREFLPSLPVRKVSENDRFEAAERSSERSRRMLVEIERLRLRPDERAEIERLAKEAEDEADSAAFVMDMDRARGYERRASVLRGLLERTGVTEAMPKEKRA